MSAIPQTLAKPAQAEATTAEATTVKTTTAGTRTVKTTVAQTTAVGPAASRPRRARTPKAAPREAAPAPGLLSLIRKVLDDGQAEDVVVIELAGKSSIADQLVIATGRSQRQVLALAQHLLDALKNAGYGRARAEGMSFGDWVLIDAGDVVVHVFRPEVRTFYNLEKMWGVTLGETAAGSDAAGEGAGLLH